MNITKLTRYFMQFLSLIFIGLLVLGLVMPRSYEVRKTITLNASPAQVKAWVWHLNTWPKWVAWQSLDSQTSFSYSKKMTGVGAHLNWQGKHNSQGELTITALNNQQLSYQILNNSQHLSHGTIVLTPIMNKNSTQKQHVQLTWHHQGENTTAVLAPYIAWFYSRNLENTLVHSLNNLATQLELAQHTHPTPLSSDTKKPSA